MATRREADSKTLPKLLEYREALVQELAEVETAEKKRQEVEQIKARLSEIESASKTSA